eukprot:750210-Hanusia_phi.AAC.1
MRGMNVREGQGSMADFDWKVSVSDGVGHKGWVLIGFSRGTQGGKVGRGGREDSKGTPLDMQT